LCRSYL